MSDWLQIRSGTGGKAVDDNNPLPTTDPRTEIALGKVSGSTAWNKFGYNADLDIGAEVVAAFGGTWAPISTATTLTAVSDNAADDDGSTGAHGLVIYGVDENWENQTVVLLLDGTTPVATTAQFLGVNRVSLFRAGSGQANAGTITITATTGGATQGTIPPGEGTTQQIILHVAANHTGLIDYVLLNAEKLSGGATPVVTFKLYVFSDVSNAKYEVLRQIIDTAAVNVVPLNFPDPLVVSEKSAIWLEATTDTNNTNVQARLSMIEVQN